MPFRSVKQAKFLYSQHPEIAKEFEGKTDFSKLPEKVDQKKQARKAAMKRRVYG